MGKKKGAADSKPKAGTANKPPRVSSRKRVERPYPRATLENALNLCVVIREKNGGNPWSPDHVASALGMAKMTNPFFYVAAAARDFGLTEGSRDTQTISLTDLGREYAYAPNGTVEDQVKRQAFFNIELFRRVLEYYKGSTLPEMKYLSNTLEREFGLAPETHDEFSQLFRENCEYLNIGEGVSDSNTQPRTSYDKTPTTAQDRPNETITLAEPEHDTGLKCFVIMPFRERDERHSGGFFDEVLRSLIVPAGRSAGFSVATANRQGTEVIHSTIINDLLNADLVVADLTEHNPNVLFELGVRMAHDKPVALIRAKGTGPVFDVDNMLRVYDYDANLWASTIERDLPKLAAHIKATWENREDENSYMKILRRVGGNGSSPLPQVK